MYVVPCRADRDLIKRLDQLRDMVMRLQRSSQISLQLRPSHAETTLIQFGHEVIMKGTNLYEASLAAEPLAGSRAEAKSNNVCVTQWVSALESLRRDQRRSDHPDMASNVPSLFSGNEAYTVKTSETLPDAAVQKRDAIDASRDESDDDLDTDLAKAALETGTKAFVAQEWGEADSLLQEALQMLQQLPRQQRAFCDILDLQYKLAVCAYHTQEAADAEEALMSLIQQSASSDEERGLLCDAQHLLSYTYIRMGQVERARAECEKALQARRRLLGKRSDASLESTALMAHIYVLLNNRARAKSCIAMIPEARRDTIVKTVEESLGTNVEHLDSRSQLARSISEDSSLTTKRIQGSLSPSPLALPMIDGFHDHISAMISQSPGSSLRQSHQRTLLNEVDSEKLHSVMVRSLSSEEGGTESGSIYPEAIIAEIPGPGETLEVNENFKEKILSRKEILDRIGCKPTDRIENAVCNGDHLAFGSLLDKRKDFWRSKLRKYVRPERVTALHFAALFGEIDMARCLLGSKFNINEVPFGYSTCLTPLKFAIGARQVDMIEFLIGNGARPSEPDSWSTLAEQLMNRSWLMKTMSEAEKEYVPNRIIAIMKILLRQGWDVNEPFETSSGRTALHQAVNFWTGSYRWDMNLRAAVSAFLCDRGADPFRANTEGKTPYDMAVSSGHQDLLLILDRGSRKNERPAELSGESVEIYSELEGMM